MQDLTGKKVLVVGGTSGIGLATAQAAYARGAEVTIASRDTETLQSTANSIGTSVLALSVDLLENESILALFDAAGSQDCVVVTAASTKTGSIHSLSLDDAYAAMDSKFWGAYRLAKAVRLNEGGSLTLTSGFLSRRPSASAVLQGAINAALEGLVRGLALELAPHRVNAVSPGLIDTALYAAMPVEKKKAMLESAKEKLPARRVGSADDVAQAILLVATNPYITGSTVVVDGGGTISA